MYKPKSDSTLKHYTKDQIIEELRCAEHNWGAAEERAEILSKRLKQLTQKLIDSNTYSIKQVNEMIALREYGERF